MGILRQEVRSPSIPGANSADTGFRDSEAFGDRDGAIGVSGAASQQDGQCAKSDAEAFKYFLALT
jgi:hypothetical protein